MATSCPVAYSRRFLDTFSLYNSIAGAQERWTSAGLASGFTTGNGGIGGAVVGPGDWYLTLPPIAGWTVHMSLKWQLPSSSNSTFLRVLRADGTDILNLTRTAIGDIVLGSTLFPSATHNLFSIPAANYATFELGFFQSTTVGRVEVRYNNTRLTQLTSSAYAGGLIGTTNMGVDPPRSLRLYNPGGLETTYDWIGIKTDTASWSEPGGGNDPWTGRKRKLILRPNGNGTYSSAHVPATAWQAVGTLPSTDLWRPIDETPFNGDVDYIGNSTVPVPSDADRGSWTYEDCPPEVSDIAWLQQVLQARSAPLGTLATIAQFLDQTGTLLDGPDVVVPSSGLHTQMLLNADTAPDLAAWTVGKVNGLHGGARLRALA